MRPHALTPDAMLLSRCMSRAAQTACGTPVTSLCSSGHPQLQGYQDNRQCLQATLQSHRDKVPLCSFFIISAYLSCQSQKGKVDFVTLSRRSGGLLSNYAGKHCVYCTMTHAKNTIQLDMTKCISCLLLSNKLPTIQRFKTTLYYLTLSVHSLAESLAQAVFKAWAAFPYEGSNWGWGDPLASSCRRWEEFRPCSAHLSATTLS